VTACLIAERVLEESDKTLTAIRLVDRITAEVPGDMIGVSPLVIPFSGAFLLMLKHRGATAGKHDVAVRIKRPSGEVTQVSHASVAIQAGEGRGANLVTRFTVGLTERGIYWFEAVVDDKLVVATPLEVVMQPGSPAGARPA